MLDSQLSINDLASPRLICLIGRDGTGKSTYTQELINLVSRNGGNAHRVWVRFPFFISIPILVYCRLTGLSYYVENQGIRYGVWEMWRSRWVPRVFPWCQLVDTFLFMLIKIYLPILLGRTIVCDRFVHDILIDTMIGIGDQELDKKPVGQLFLSLAATNQGKLICLDLPQELALKRRPELKWDPTWSHRRIYYQEICQENAIPIIDNSFPREVVLDQILKIIAF
jgi:thymidylate kinase